MIVYMCEKFDDSSFSRSRDISLRVAKFKMGHLTLTKCFKGDSACVCWDLILLVHEI